MFCGYREEVTSNAELSEKLELLVCVISARHGALWVPVKRNGLIGEERGLGGCPEWVYGFASPKWSARSLSIWGTGKGRAK